MYDEKIPEKKTAIQFTICDFSDPFCVKEFPHTVQMYGLRPSWVILCRVKLVRVENVLSQTSQRLS